MAATPTICPVSLMPKARLSDPPRVPNGCTDRTAAVAQETFQEQTRSHPFKDTFSCRSLNIVERGKTNAWNLFVHSLSAKTASILFLMDGDIVLHRPETLWNMHAVLLNNLKAAIATDQPLKDIAFRQHPSLRSGKVRRPPA